MTNEVYANGMEIACKAGAGKVIAAFPDVCMTPPENPATPPGIPVPYPNTGFSSDTTDGSKNVKISDKEVMLKNKSCFKKSVGDEAGCAAKKGVISSKNTGKVYFIKWSMDVKVEGENVDRHLDMTTNNHGSPTANEGLPWVYLDTAAITNDKICRKEKKKVATACNPEKDWKKNCPTPPPSIDSPPKDKKSVAYHIWQLDNKARLELFDEFSKDCKDSPCLRARKCVLVSKRGASKDSSKRECCPGQTGHHLIEGASFKGIDGWGEYNYEDAPTVCAEGPSWHTGTHQDLHLYQAAAATNLAENGEWSRRKATKAGAKALRKTFQGSGCSTACIEAQLNHYHDNICTIQPEPELNAQINAVKDEELRGVAELIMGF